MEAVKVGIREFRNNLTTYLDSDSPVAITRHCDTVGVYVPARRKRTLAEKASFEEAAARWQAELDRVGITEEDALEDSMQWRNQWQIS